MKTTPMFLAAAAALAVLTVSCSRDSDGESGASYDPSADPDRLIAVEAMTATRSALVDEVRGAGIAEGVREAWVVSETEGVILEVDFALGDRVDSGQVLLRVDDSLALRNLELARQQYETASLEHEAAGRSRENGSMSALQYSQITDRLLAAEAARASALDAYENTRLTAPFAGAVAARDRNLGVGNYLNRGLRAVRIVDDSAFRTEISVGEGQVFLIREGAEARIVGGDGVVRSGRVAAVSAGSDEGTGSFAVVLEWIPEPDDPLRSGMSVNVSIEAAGDREEIIVPASAIRRRDGRDYVFVASEDKAENRAVTVGSRLGERVEVLEGLREGETLIISGLASLTPGIPVSVTVVGDSGEVR